MSSKINGPDWRDWKKKKKEEKKRLEVKIENFKLGLLLLALRIGVVAGRG